MKKRILITGVNGFLGGALWSYLESHGSQFDVFGVDIRGGKSGTGKKRIVCDLTRPRQLAAVLSRVRPDCIFHLAGGRASDRQVLFEGTFRTTQILLETVRNMRECHARIIIPGSAAEYGNPSRNRKKISEKTDLQSVSWYGFVKNLQTGLAMMYASSGLDVVVPRLFNIAGYGTPETLALGRFAREIVCVENGRKPAAFSTGNLTGKRDFLDIMDICSGLLAVAKKGRSGEVYNVCSSTAYSVRDLLKKLISDSTVKDIQINEKKADVSEIFDSVGSNVKIKKETGWRPRVTIRQSLKNTLQYYRDMSSGR